MKSKVKYLLSIFKTVYINYKCLDLKKAYKLPIFVSYDTKLYNLAKKSIDIKSKDLKTAMIKIGFGGTTYIPNQKGAFQIDKGGKVIFYGKAFLGEGTCIFVENDAKLVFKNNFASNKNCIFHSAKEITFEENTLVGWNTNFRDNDGHTIVESGTKKENRKSISIDKNVWIGSYVDILKGVKIGADSVVATRSCVTKEFNKNNILLGGYPAKIIKEDILWEK